MKNTKDERMTSLRILVVEDDYLQANQLAEDIRAGGDQVVGPFPEVHEAIYYVDTVQAAILDVRLQDDTSFAVADSLTYHSIPFLFLTGYAPQAVPLRFKRCHIYPKPSTAAPLLHDLHHQHRQHRPSDPSEALSFEDVVKGMIVSARHMMPDHGSADRLVEGVLHRAIVQADRGTFTGDAKERLTMLLHEEYRLRAARYPQ